MTACGGFEPSIAHDRTPQSSAVSGRRRCWRGSKQVAIFLAAWALAAPAQASAHRHRALAASQPSSIELVRAMTVAADEWWTLQGSPPPCPYRAEIRWGVAVDGYTGYAEYGSCAITLDPHWWQVQYAYLTGHASRRARIRDASYALALVIHERGHNLGYRHVAGTVMQAETPVVPGWAYAWAARTIR